MVENLDARERVLAVDVGNTVTKIGLFADGELAGTCSLTTPERLTQDEAALELERALARIPGGAGAPAGSILACVVPALAGTWERALRAAVSGRALVVGPGLKTGLTMRYDDPAEVGADRVADAVAARAALGSPVVVVDLGTTTTFEVVDGGGAFAGGIIAPGMALGAVALAAGAAQLPMVGVTAPRRTIGRSTREAMRAGVVLGEVARIDGLLDLIMAELGAEAPVILTGEPAPDLAPLLKREAVVREHLTLEGLGLLWQANRRR
ncbi:MAG: type III pantothenate kinase [Collinsella sp.]|nr:type III pantothenate kinase [Collinsella sp.]